MSIKSDKWIRRMVDEMGMIEPFEPGQCREVSGEKIISYGTSSYGYDVRCSDEFKIFTNVNSATIDPKHFDPNSFVDFKGDCCIIPPNSFALARTVEYFRIPRFGINHLSGEIHLRPLRHYCERHAAGTRVGRAGHPGILQHHHTPCQDLCQRGRGANVVL